MEAQLVRAEMRQGFEGLHRRLDDLIARVDAINGKVGKAHDRAAKLEAIAQNLTGAIAWLRKQIGRLDGQIREVRDTRSDSGDGTRITRSDLKWIFAIASGAVGITLGVLKLVGKI